MHQIFKSFLLNPGARVGRVTSVTEKPIINHVYPENVCHRLWRCHHSTDASLWAQSHEQWLPRPRVAIPSDPPPACSATHQLSWRVVISGWSFLSGHFRVAIPRQPFQGSLPSKLLPAGSHGLTGCWEATFPAAFPFHFDVLHYHAPQHVHPGHWLWVLLDASSDGESSYAWLSLSLYFLQQQNAFNFSTVNAFKLHTCNCKYHLVKFISGYRSLFASEPANTAYILENRLHFSNKAGVFPKIR